MARPEPELRIVEVTDDSFRGDESVAYLFQEMRTAERVWIAVANDEMVGGLRLTLRSGATGVEQIGPNVVVHTVSVHQPHQRRGYGRALMEFGERWLQQQASLPHTLSLAVEVDNVVAIALYESLGYSFVIAQDERLRTGDLSCFVMAKTLSG